MSWVGVWILTFLALLTLPVDLNLFFRLAGCASTATIVTLAAWLISLGRW